MVAHAQDFTSQPRLVAGSRSGRFVLIRQKSGLDVVDALGTTPRRSIPSHDITDFCAVANEVWIVSGGVLARYRVDSGKQIGDVIELPLASGRLTPAPRQEHGHAAMWGDSCLLRLVSNSLEVDELEDIAGSDMAMPIGGSRLMVAADGVLRVIDVQKGELSKFPIGGEGRVYAATILLGGRAYALHRGKAVHVLRPSGESVHRISIPDLERVQFAETRGVALTYTAANHLRAIDLRFGKQMADAEAPVPLSDFAIDADGKYLALAGFRPDDGHLAVLHMTYAELFGGRLFKSSTEGGLDGDGATDSDGDGEAELEDAIGNEPPPGQAEAESAERKDDLESWEVPDIPLLALGQPKPAIEIEAPEDIEPYHSHHEHLHDLLDLVVARTARAIADSWDSGRLSFPAQDSRPFECEVKALVGIRIASAPEEVAAADRRVAQLTSMIAGRARASLAGSMVLPFVEIVREFELSAIAAQVLLVVAAPAIRGEIARLYGVLSNDENRPICDRHLVEMILAGAHNESRDAVARELSDDSTLLKHGLVRALPGPDDQYLFAPITVDPVFVSRLRGKADEIIGVASVATIRYADRELSELAVPKAALREAVTTLARPKPNGQPPRLVLRGRPGSGRRTFMASLAARAGKSLAIIDAERLPRGGQQFSARLRIELRRAGLRGAIPCVGGLHVLSGENVEGIEHVQEVFRTHPGPIFVRTSPEGTLPLDPGYLSLTLPALTDSARHKFWQQGLERHGLKSAAIDQLAARFRVGPGTIEQILAATVQKRSVEAEPSPDASEDLDQAARQHIDARLGSVATKVTRLARWEQVALPSDVFDSIKEFLGRVKFRRTVYDSWGFDKKMTTSRGLTALFHGPPGTGKSMVAGLIARELGLDLYRVDLARITSKWIGETEKNLSQIFDAAEDGQAVILFDEADSLFAKRTEVKSSVDRYANLEVNYLLQRFDSFDGVAILTTNLAGSLDSAFKRRLSLRLGFPFPDEEMRVRLWSAHLPAEVPIAGDFDFDYLAKRFPMSGGYIRNSSLRAAFLAAQEDVPLSQQHLERAIQLEYREMGKLSPGGKLE